MATLDDVAQFLGLSKRAVRLRVNALGDMLEGHLARGDRNRLIFRGEAVAILHRLEELRQREGLAIRQAVSRLRGELVGDDTSSGIYILIKPEIELLQDALVEAYRERDRWREYAFALQSVLPPELTWLNAVAPPDCEDRRLN
ncbi:MAG: hypothetical protein WBC63_01045 [Candidatus Bipolaricaulia bacterium]